jgi:hypothetical protein
MNWSSNSVRCPALQVCTADESGLGHQFGVIQHMLAALSPAPALFCDILNQSSEVSSHMLPAIAGWLLGYPVLYCFRPTSDGGGNCLGGTLLKLVTVRVFCEEIQAEVDALQFSFPGALLDDER